MGRIEAKRKKGTQLAQIRYTKHKRTQDVLPPFITRSSRPENRRVKQVTSGDPHTTTKGRKDPEDQELQSSG